MPERWRAHPSVQRLARIARALEDLNDRIVFIGGAVAPILQTDPPFLTARTTKGVDALAATTSYVDLEALQAGLRAAGFRNPAVRAEAPGDSTRGRRAHRWTLADGTRFALAPAGCHIGASGQMWDRVAVETAQSLEVEPGLTVRHASAPGFLALKWAAFTDRGAGELFASHDIEDIIALVASRATIASEVLASPKEIRFFLKARFAWLAAQRDFADVLAESMNGAFNAATAMDAARARIMSLSAGA